MIPEYTKYQIDQYVKHGIPLGDFLTAVMSNDLMETFKRADEDNLAHIFEIVQYVYNHVPMNCYGSKEKIEAWLKEKNDDNVCIM